MVNATTRPLNTGKDTMYPLCKRLGEPQGRSERVRKILPAPGFDARSIQPVASRYTEYDIPVHTLTVNKYINK